MWCSGPDSRWHGELGGDSGVGDLGAPEKAGALRQGNRRARQGNWKGEVGGGERHPKSTIPRHNRQRDHAYAPGGTNAGAQVLQRGYKNRRLRYSQRHQSPRKRMDHRERPRDMGPTQ